MEEAITFTWVNLGLNLLPGGHVGLIQAAVRRWPPGPEPNAVYGYRTKRSMASPEAWAFANRRSIDLYALYSWPLMAAAVPCTLYVPVGTEYKWSLYGVFTWPASGRC